MRASRVRNDQEVRRCRVIWKIVHQNTSQSQNRNLSE